MYTNILQVQVALRGQKDEEETLQLSMEINLLWGIWTTMG